MEGKPLEGEHTCRNHITHFNNLTIRDILPRMHFNLFSVSVTCKCQVARWSMIPNPKEGKVARCSISPVELLKSEQDPCNYRCLSQG